MDSQQSSFFLYIQCILFVNKIWSYQSALHLSIFPLTEEMLFQRTVTEI